MKTEIHTNAAPAPIGPYSQGIAYENLVFTSGQIAIDPITGSLVNDSIEAETEMVLENLKSVLEAGGAAFDSVLKCSIFIKDMDQFQQINTVYEKYFGLKVAPARETVQVARLPKDVAIEISAIAYRKWNWGPKWAHLQGDDKLY